MENSGVSALCVHPGGIRTNIANAARMNDSLRAFGMNPEKSAKAFNKLARRRRKKRPARFCRRCRKTSAAC